MSGPVVKAPLRRVLSHACGPWTAAHEQADGAAAAASGEADLALWRLPPRPALERWLDALPPEELPRVHDEVPADAAAALVLAACNTVGHEAGDTAGLLAGEIGQLVLRFAQLGGLRTIDLRLNAIDHDACRLFHRDRVALRLITTYRGPGTQLVPPGHAADALRGQARYEGPLHGVERRTVALFRGSAEGEAGVVHRSPPLRGLGITRLVLCLSVPFR